MVTSQFETNFCNNAASLAADGRVNVIDVARKSNLLYNLAVDKERNYVGLKITKHTHGVTFGITSSSALFLGINEACATETDVVAARNISRCHIFGVFIGVG